MLFLPLVAGRRVVLLGAQVLSAVLGKIGLLFGRSDASNVVVHQMGRAAGAAWIDEFAKNVDFSILKKNQEHVFKLFSYLDPGLFKVVSFDAPSKTVMLDMEEGFECKGLTREKEPQSHFIRRVVEGAVGKLLDQSIDLKETLCDPVCRFISAPRTSSR